MIYKISNPSDPYTCEVEDFKTAAVMVCLLGEGKYPLVPLEEGAQRVPAFFFGGHDEWFQEKFNQNFDEALRNIPPHQLAEAFNSVLVGGKEDRATYEEGLALIDDPQKKLTWQKNWLDRKRGSMNNIGGKAIQLAQMFREMAIA
jgi:hypothetical protein